jgi:hypothetical protein
VPEQCDHCDGPINRDERILVIDGEEGRWTTLRAEPDACRTECFHSDCFLRMREGGALDWLRVQEQ